jgi:hypothetical protein
MTCVSEQCDYSHLDEGISLSSIALAETPCIFPFRREVVPQNAP